MLNTVRGQGQPSAFYFIPDSFQTSPMWRNSFLAGCSFECQGLFLGRSALCVFLNWLFKGFFDSEHVGFNYPNSSPARVCKQEVINPKNIFLTLRQQHPSASSLLL